MPDPDYVSRRLAGDHGPVPVTIENADMSALTSRIDTSYGPQEPELNGWSQPGPVVIPDYSAEGSSGWRGGSFDEGRFGDDELAVQGIDELRQAMDVGGQTIAQGGQEAGNAFGQSAGAALSGQAETAGNAYGLSAARAFNANVRVPSAPAAAAGGTGASGRKGLSSTDAGVAQ